MTQRQQAAVKVFRRKYPLVSCAAIVGSLTGESGTNLNSTVNRAHPDASGGRTGDDRSGGIAEWLNQTPGRGRKADMIAFAAAHGKPADDLEIQCLFVMHELEEQQYAGLDADLLAGVKSIKNLTWNFTKFFERPNMAVAHMDDLRVPQAEKVLRDAKIGVAADGAIVIGSGGVITAGGAAAAQGVTTMHLLAAVLSALLPILGTIAKWFVNRPQVGIPSPPLPDITRSQMEELKAAVDAMSAALNQVNAAKAAIESNIKQEQELIAAIPSSHTGNIKE